MSYDYKYYEDVRRRFRMVVTVLGVLVLGVGLGAVIYLGLLAQFAVYQKKHGEHMTMWDFLIDTERK